MLTEALAKIPREYRATVGTAFIGVDHASGTDTSMNVIIPSETAATPDPVLDALPPTEPRNRAERRARKTSRRSKPTRWRTDRWP